MQRILTVHRRLHRNRTPAEKTGEQGNDEYGSTRQLASEALKALINKVSLSPVLALPKAVLPSLGCYASNYFVRYAIFQTHPDDERKPIGFRRRSFLPVEEIYLPSDRKCLSVVLVVDKLRPYLIYDWFTVFTDHAAFRWLLIIEDHRESCIRWRLFLAEFDFQVK